MDQEQLQIQKKTWLWKDHIITAFSADTHILKDDAFASYVYANISAERQKKVDDCKQAAARERTLLASGCLDVMTREFGFPEKELTYSYGKWGKPSFSELPKLAFNLSHSGTKILLCYVWQDTDSILLGCDVEQIKEARMGVSSRFFHPMEHQYLENLPKEQLNQEFFRLWTMKESYIKASGQGMTCSLQKFNTLTSLEGDFKLLQFDRDYQNMCYAQIC